MRTDVRFSDLIKVDYLFNFWNLSKYCREREKNLDSISEIF